jgi:hypothetical protein
VQVTNTGSVAAKEVVQAYVWPSLQPRLKSLAAFEQTTVMQPGDGQTGRRLKWKSAFGISPSGLMINSICREEGTRSLPRGMLATARW